MKKYKYRILNELNEELVNDLGSKGYKMCRFFGSPSLIIMELEYEIEENVNDSGSKGYNVCDVVEENEEDLMPVAATILDPLALYRCIEKINRYYWGNTYVHPKFLTLEDFKNGDFYSDDGEYEAYLSDGFYFIGTNLSSMTEEEYEKFIGANKNKFRDPNNLKIYYIDYPEDK